MASLRDLTPNRPTELGRQVGAELARLTERATAKLIAQGVTLPSPCNSCAFRRDTVPNGCEETIMDALKCAVEGSRDFMCHEVPHGQEPNKLCGGYQIVRKFFAEGGLEGLELPWEFSPDYLDSNFICTASEIEG